MTAGNLEGTTMETIARMLYDEEGDLRPWEKLSDGARIRYRRLAVRIIDTAEPVWWERTAVARRALQRKAWNEGFDEASDDIGRAELMAEYGESVNPYEGLTDG